MPQIKSSFALNSKYPLDIRDSFDTLEELKNPGILFDEGHITYCKETGKHYIYDDKYWNNLSGYFKEFVVSGGGSTPDDIQSILDDKVDKEDGKGLSTNDFTNDYKSTLDNLNLDLESKYILKLPFNAIIEENTAVYKRDITPEMLERLEFNPIYFLKNPFDISNNVQLKPQFVCYDDNSNPPYKLFNAESVKYFNKSKLSKYQDIDGNISSKLFINNDNIYIHSNGNLLTLDNLEFDSESKYILKLPFEGIIEENVTVNKIDIIPERLEYLKSHPIYFLKNPFDISNNIQLKPQFAYYDNNANPHYILFNAGSIEYFNELKLSQYQDNDGNILSKLFINNDNIYFHSNGNLLTLNDILLTSDNSNSGNINPGGQILPEYKENSVLWSNYGKTLEWTDKFNSVDYLGVSNNPISQSMFTFSRNKRIVYQTWVDAFNENYGDYPMYIILNGHSILIREPLDTEVENPEEPGGLSKICICPVPLLTIDNPEKSFCNIYNHEIIFMTGKNIPNVSYIDSMGFELLWEKSSPILEPNKIYKISFDTSITYNPETFENDNMIITGRWVELIGGNTTYGLRKPNFKEIYDMIKEKGEVK